MDRTPAHLADMLGFVRELRSLVAPPLTVQAFEAQRVLCLAVEKLFINLGEAAYRVDAATAARLPEIPWRQVIGLRNILAHGYEHVAHEVLFKTIRDDLPALELAVTEALNNFDSGSA
ncbi:DUF86 domain-containing protein [Paracidovorax sp. MALMAid1276]|uniref:HepT-like ribonuclease domain-containing protein n=1 Tax=Paracidovorax sp. MALMAid1276 TaxID=3411631 RepID=UPI003BA3C69F